MYDEHCDNVILRSYLGNNTKKIIHCTPMPTKISIYIWYILYTAMIGV